MTRDSDASLAENAAGGRAPKGWQRGPKASPKSHEDKDMNSQPNPPTQAEELLPVTQADRDAAADLADWLTAAQKEWGDGSVWFARDFAKVTRNGIWDNHDFVQAFARHRIVAESTTTNEARTPGEGELARLVHENGPVVIDACGEGLAWRPLDYGTWTPLTPPKLADSDLASHLQRWRDNLAITRNSPVKGDYLHGPALDFVIEQLDEMLARAAQRGQIVAGEIPRHSYKPHHRFPWFCGECGYPEHETLKHLPPAYHLPKPTDPRSIAGENEA